MTERDIQIESRNLNLWYGDAQALKNVTIAMPGNKVTAVIGPSGCGKFTFIRCINRMNDLIKDCRITGELLFGGKNIYDRDINVVAIRKKIGMVFQKPNPFPMPIYDNVAYGPHRNGVRDRHELDEVVETSLVAAALWGEVDGKLDIAALDLSGGQQQRLCIARTLAVKPEVILFDEPCSALDPISTARIEDLIGELKRDYTIIIVTHNMQQAARVSDYTAFFLLGEMIELGKTSRSLKIRRRRVRKIISQAGLDRAIRRDIMVQKQYQTELTNVQQNVLRLGELANSAIKDSVEALQDHNVEQAEAVITGDSGIDGLSADIDALCMQLPVLKQPVDRDLWTIGAVVKINLDIERMSDLAVDIARVAIATRDKKHVRSLIDISAMAHIACEMLGGALRAFGELNSDLACEIAKLTFRRSPSIFHNFY